MPRAIGAKAKKTQAPGGLMGLASGKTGCPGLRTLGTQVLKIGSQSTKIKNRDKTFKPLLGARGERLKRGRQCTEKAGSQLLKGAWGPPIQDRFRCSFPRGNFMGEKWEIA